MVSFPLPSPPLALVLNHTGPATVNSLVSQSVDFYLSPFYCLEGNHTIDYFHSLAMQLLLDFYNQMQRIDTLAVLRTAVLVSQLLLLDTHHNYRFEDQENGIHQVVS